MNDEDYIKSRRYGLLYIYNLQGVALKHIQSFCTNDEGKSVVLSARGSSIDLKDNLYSQQTIDIKNPAHGNGGCLSGTIDPMSLYSWLCFSSLSQVKNLLRNNIEHVKWIRQIFRILNAESCKCLIILMDLTGVQNKSIEEVDYITFLKLKIGGEELISEFLLSNFIRIWEEEFENQKLDPTCEEYQAKAYGEKYNPFRFMREIEIGECSPIFRIHNFSDLEHLTKYKYTHETDDETFETYLQKEGSYVYFNIDLDKIQKIDDEYRTPKKIKATLNESQLKNLAETAPLVILDNFKYVYTVILKQKIP